MENLQTKSWVIDASLYEVDNVCREINLWLLEQDLSTHQFPIELLTREALNNAIIHGSNLDPLHQVHCDLQLSNDMLCLTIRDDGPGFDWRQHLQEEIVDNDRENGRGIQLYRLYADSIEFNSCGNQVMLVRLLNAKDINMESSVEPEARQFFYPNGDLTVTTAQEIRIQLKDMIQRGLKELVIDLANTRVIDSTGIGLLVATHNSLHRIDAQMALINVSQDLLELLKAFRLDKHFSISGDPRLE